LPSFQINVDQYTPISTSPSELVNGERHNSRVTKYHSFPIWDKTIPLPNRHASLLIEHGLMRRPCASRSYTVMVFNAGLTMSGASVAR
jgi:hypothetical protein